MSEALSLQEPISPGSLENFATTIGLEATNPTARAAYSGALAEYRVQLAIARGISLEELHGGTFRRMVKIVPGETASSETP